MRIVMTIMAVLVLALAAPAGAAVLFVDNDFCPNAYPNFCFIQDAIDVSFPGDTILVINTGIDYLQSDTLVIPWSNVTLVSGRARIVHDFGCCAPLVRITADDVRLQGFEIVGNGQGHCIRIQGASDVLVVNNYIHDCGGDGVNIGEVTFRNLVIGNLITAVGQNFDGDGVDVQFDFDGSRHTISWNVINGTGNRGIEVGQQKVLVQNNAVFNADDEGIRVSFSGKQVKVRDNVVFGSGDCDLSRDDNVTGTAFTGNVTGSPLPSGTVCIED